TISVFFFSSRRRHTRFSRDWSSDVCSSDLLSFFSIRRIIGEFILIKTLYFYAVKIHEKYMLRCIQLAKNGLGTTYPNPLVGSVKIGRASCRERVERASCED